MGYAALLLGASIVPSTQQPTDPLQHFFILISPTLQNILHIPAYALLAWLTCDALSKCRPSRKTSLFIGMATAMSYGMIMEAAQMWVPGRYPSIMDIGFNALGAGIGSWMWGKRKGRVSSARDGAMPTMSRH